MQAHLNRRTVFTGPRTWLQDRRQRRVRSTVRLLLEALEERLSPAGAQWIGGSGDFNDTTHWAAGVVPGPSDDVVIDVPGITVTHSTGNHTIQSLTSNDGFVLSGGTLTVTGSLQQQSGNTFALQGGTLAGATVFDSTLTATGTASYASATLSGVTLQYSILDMQANTCFLNVSGPLTLSDSTAYLGNVSGTTFGRLSLVDSAAQVLDGASSAHPGTFVFGSSGNNGIFGSNNSGAFLTLGKNLTLKAAAGMVIAYTGMDVQAAIIAGPTVSGESTGTITVNGNDWTNDGTLTGQNGGSLDLEGANWVNDATVNVDGGGNLTIGGRSYATAHAWTNNGSISFGGGGTMTLNASVYGTTADNSSWVNAGTITATGAATTVDLGGTFTMAALGNFSRVSGPTDAIVDLTGTLNNAGQTLTLNNTTGSWNFAGGTINGGALAATPGYALVNIVSASSYLRDVTLDGNGGNVSPLDMQSHSTSLMVSGSLTLDNATIDLGNGNLTSPTVGQLFFMDNGPEILNGLNSDHPGSIVFGTGGSNGIYHGYYGGTLTLGRNLTVRGASGQINMGSNSMDFQSTLTVDPTLFPGQTTGRVSINGTSWTNDGTVTAQNGGEIDIITAPTNFAGGTLTGGTWQAINGGTLRLIGESITTDAASLLIDGAGSHVYSDLGTSAPNPLANLAAIAAGGDLTIQNGYNLTTASDLSNSGSLTIGPSSTLTVSGNYTQTSGAALGINIGSVSDSGMFGTLSVAQAVTLAGDLDIGVVNGFAPSHADSFTILSFAAGSRSTDFANKNGLAFASGQFTPVYGDSNLILNLAPRQAPAITSGNSATFAVGATGGFTVLTTGAPVPTLTESGALAAGVTFADNADGTASLSGTPADGTGGTYSFTITASNGVGDDATQNFILAVDQAPAITSAGTTTFREGTSGTFIVQTTGFPAASLNESGTLPRGVAFTDNGNGTATLAGTPAVGMSGNYTLAIIAHNSSGADATQSFTLTVNTGPSITSASSSTFTVGTSGTFTVQTSGFQTPSLTIPGDSLPGGVTFTDNGDGTATLGGIPTAGSGGAYVIPISAGDATDGTVTQSFTLTVDELPTIQSVNDATFVAGSPGSFTVQAKGFPVPQFTESGRLPNGVTFTAATGVLTGTPAPGTAGFYSIAFTAGNAVGSTTQSFTLTVKPGFVSADHATVNSLDHATGIGGRIPGVLIRVQTTETYNVALSIPPKSLPGNLVFTDGGHGIGAITGNLLASSGGTYTFPITAIVGADDYNLQTFTLTVNQPATIVSSSAAFNIGTAGSVTVQTSGFPAPQLSETGALPSGIVFAPGTGTFSGTPASGTAGVYHLTLTANNNIRGPISHAFTLIVNKAPVFTTADHATLLVGRKSNLPIAVGTTGFAVAPTLSIPAHSLPRRLTFPGADDVISGTLAVGTGGIYAFPITASDGPGSVITQNFTLTVNETPAITAPYQIAFTAGAPGSFIVGTRGFPRPTLTASPPLPAGAFTDNGNGTATLSGTSLRSGTYSFDITASNNIATVTHHFKVVVMAYSATATTIVASAKASVPGEPVSFTAQVICKSGKGPPDVSVLTGTVTFVDREAGRLGTVPLINGMATCTTSALQFGKHDIMALFSGGPNFAGSKSTALAHNVQHTVVEPDPVNPSLNHLAVGTFPGDVTVLIRTAPSRGRVQGKTVDIGVGVQSGGSSVFRTTVSIPSLSGIIVYGGSGNDTVTADVSVPVFFLAGSGNNVAHIVNGPSVLVGGAGQNTLQAGVSRSILIAGSGPAHLAAGQSETILVGGTTDYDGNVAALEAIMAEWSRVDEDYQTRVNHLVGPGAGGSAGGRNGSYFLNASTAHASSAADTLVGGPALAWYFGNPSQDTLEFQRADENVSAMS
jgi:hypothetical protein